MKFLIGFVVGVGLGLLYAPAAGARTRSRLAEKGRELADLPRKNAIEVADRTKEKAGDIGERIGRQAGEAAVETLEEGVLGKKQEKTA